MAVFNSRRLNDLAEVEQDMVMGETAEGDAPENIEGRVKTLLADPTITYAPSRACDPDAGCAHTESVRERGGKPIRPDDKLRLVLLYRNYKGPLGSEDRAAIGVERSGLNNADLQAITNMDLLGANKDSVWASRCRRGHVVAAAVELTERGRASVRDLALHSKSSSTRTWP